MLTSRSQMPRALRRCRLSCLADAVPIVAALAGDSHRGENGVDLVVVDRRGRLVALCNLPDAHESEVPELAALVAEATPRRGWGLLVVSRRPDVPAEIPELELAWEEASAAVHTSPLTLLDWLVVARRRFALSVAEFAPSRPAWSIRNVPAGLHADVGRR